MSDSQRVPDWQVERLALGELPAHLRADIEAQLSAEPNGDARLEVLRESDAEILEQLPATDVIAEIEMRRRTLVAADRQQSRRRMWIGGGVVAAAAAITLLFVLPRSMVSDTAPAIDDGHEVTRPKGDARLLLHRKVGDRTEKLDHNSIAHLSDRIQLFYRGAGATHGVIASLDGRGEVTVHFPDDGQPTRLQSGQVKLQHSYELDDAPRFERFFFVTSPSPIDVAVVTSRVRKLASDLRTARTKKLSLPTGLSQWTFVLRKGSAP